MQFEDKDAYLLTFLLPLSILLFLLNPFANAVLVIQFTLSAVASLLFYFILWLGWPDVFPVWTLNPMLIMVLVIMLALIGLIYMWIWVAAIIFLALVAIPALYHNAAWMALMFGAPLW